MVGDRSERKDVFTVQRIPYCDVGRRSLATTQIINTALSSGMRNPTRKLPEYFDKAPTSHGLAEPPSEAIANKNPPMCFARSPYHFESQAM